MSTLYHSFHPPHLKRIFKVLDHVAIYLLIAGTYTPYMLVSLRDGNGFLIMGIIWMLALAGILSELFLSGRAWAWAGPALSTLSASGRRCRRWACGG
jgi:hemolysin III